MFQTESLSIISNSYISYRLRWLFASGILILLASRQHVLHDI